MTDLAALRTYIEGDVTLMALLAAGNNGELVRRINETPDAGRVPIVARRDDVLAAIGDGLRLLTDPQLQKLRILMSGETVDFRLQAVQAEVREVFVGQTTVLSRIAQAVTRPKRLADRFGAEEVSLHDVRAVAKAVPSSLLNSQDEAARAARAQLINETGVKIRSLRGQMPTDQYIAWRNSLYDIHGADQAETDQLRAQAVDAKVAEVSGA